MILFNKKSMSPTPVKPKVIYIIPFIAVGLFIIGFGIFSYLRSNLILENGVHTIGKVTQVFRDIHAKRPDYYFPIIDFQNEEKKNYSFKSDVGYTSPGEYQVGQTVSIIYNPSNPTEAKIDSFIGIWWSTILPILIGFIFSSLGVAIYFEARKKYNLTEFLSKNGIKIKANVYSVNEIASSTSKKCVINAKFDQNGKKYLFSSDILNIDPDKIKDLKEIEVLADPSNYTRYIIPAEPNIKS